MQKVTAGRETGYKLTPSNVLKQEVKRTSNHSGTINIPSFSALHTFKNRNRPPSPKATQVSKTNINQLAKPVNKEQDEIEDVTEDEEEVGLPVSPSK